MIPEPAVVTGYGYTGARLARRLKQRGYRTRIIVRRDEAARDASAAGHDAIQADLDTPASLGNVDLTAATLFHLVPPAPEGVRDTRLRALLDLATERAPARLVLLSTTGVYGNHDGALVNEDVALTPTSERAVRRLDAECFAAQFCDRTGCELVIMRVAGIYGPDRLPLARLKRRDPLPSRESCGITNRIHVDDLVASLIAGGERGESGRAYNVADGTGWPMRNWFEAVADAAGLEHPPEVSMAGAGEMLSPALMSYLRESRHIDNTRLIEELAVELQFGDPLKGIADSLARGAQNIPGS